MVRRRVDKAWFQGQLRRVDSSQRKLAQTVLRVDPSAVTLMLTGERKVQLDEAVKIARHIGQPLGEVIERFGLSIDDVTRGDGSVVPVVGVMDAQGRVTIDQGRAVGVVTAPPDAPPGTVAIAGNTSLTGMDMLDGWLVYYAPQPTVGVEAIGRLCVVETEEGTVLSFLRRAKRNGIYTLLSALTGETTDAAVISASPVLWIQP